MLLPKSFKGPDPGIFLTSLHLLSLLDILCQLPLDVLQRAFTALAGSRRRVWDSLQGLRASSKAGRDLVDSCIQHVDVSLPRIPAQGTRIAQLLANLTQLQRLSVVGNNSKSAYNGQALCALFEALPPLTRITELELHGTNIGSTAMAEVSQKLYNLEKLSLDSCGADDANLLKPLAACQQLASLSVSSPSYGDLPSFEETLPGLGLLTQLTKLHWATDVEDASLLLHISKLTRLISIEVDPEPDGTAQALVHALVLGILPNLEEAHVRVLTAVHLAALTGSTSITHLKLDYANLRAFDDVCATMGFENLQGMCIPNLKKISFVNRCDEVICSPKTIRELLEVAPGLQSLKWGYGDIIELDARITSEPSDLAWLLERSDVVTDNLFDSVRLHGCSAGEDVDAYLTALPAILSCIHLSLGGFNFSPARLATLVQKFPGVQLLYIRAAAVEPGALPGILAWPALEKVRLHGEIQDADVAAFRGMCGERSVTLE